MIKNKNRSIPAVVHKYGWDAQAAVPGLTITPYEVMRERQSGHGVMFGKLSGGEQVVVKPHVKEGKADYEALQIERFAERGINTPAKIGTYPGREATYLVTEKYEGLRTLGDMCWRASVADRVRPRLMHDLELGARNLAELHSHGASHGDYAIKNVGLGPEAEPVFFDLERSQLDERGRGSAIERTNDLYMLGGSALGDGLLYDRSPSYRIGALRIGLVDPYVDLVIGDKVDHDLLERAQRVSLAMGRIIPINTVIKNSGELLGNSQTIIPLDVRKRAG